MFPWLLQMEPNRPVHSTLQAQPHPAAPTTPSSGCSLSSRTPTLSHRRRSTRLASFSGNDSAAHLQQAHCRQRSAAAGGSFHRAPTPRRCSIRYIRPVSPFVDCTPVSLTAVHIRPGTGKTITMVEGIQQVLRLNPDARILVCAPSNSAADLLSTRLSSLGLTLFRFYAPSRNKELIPDALIPFTHRTVDGHFSVPPLAIVQRFRVVVSTCVSAAFAHGVGVPRGHFSHIFVDEAGQATEPEVMVALRTMADHATNVVLSGDPKQLGPIVRSAVARELGLEKSYIERLMLRPAYDEGEGHGVS